MIQVQTNKVNWNIVPTGMTYIFFGPPKTHKTTEASCWSAKGSEGVLLIDTELGSDYVDKCNRIVCTSYKTPTRPILKNGQQQLDGRGLPAVEVVPPIERGYYFVSGDNKGDPMPTYSFEEILNYIATQIELNDFPYTTIVIDTIDEINDWAEKETCKELGISAIGQGEYGADWALARNKVKNAVSYLKQIVRKSSKDLILISHAKTAVMLKNKIQLGPDLPKGTSKALMGMAEIIGYVSIDEKSKKSLITFDGMDEMQMGSRLRPLAGKTIEFNYKTFAKEITSYTT